jgi:hypothetical protein
MGPLNDRVNRIVLALLALLVAGSVVLLLRGHSDAAEATPKQLAERDVARRLADAALPPGSHRVSSLPKSLRLDGPGETPATPNLVDRGAQYVASMGAAKALAWFKAHPPAGARQLGTGTSGGRGTVTINDVTFESDELPAIRERRLLIAVAARPGGGAAVRIDAQAVWVTPHPKAAVVPSAAKMLELEYAHRGESPRTATVTKAAEVAAYAHLIDTAEAAQPGTVSCPMIPSNSPVLTLTFKASGGGPALAVARQELPGGCGQPLKLTVEGKETPNLSVSAPLVRRALARLGVKAGDKG